MSQDFDNDNKDAVVFATSLVGQVNREDVGSMVQVQREMLSRFEKTNEMLINFNLLSGARYEASVKDFQTHTQLLADMRQDLDSIFKRIRVLKQRLSKSYPEAFTACSSVIMMEDEEAEEDRLSAAATSRSGQSSQPPVQIKVDAHGEPSKDNTRGSEKKPRKGSSSTHHSGDKHGERRSREEKAGSGHKHTSSHRSHSGHTHKSGQSHSHSHSHSGGQMKSKTSH